MYVYYLVFVYDIPERYIIIKTLFMMQQYMYTQNKYLNVS